jgi:hypothetical protein
LNIPPGKEYSLAELAQLAVDQGNSDTHRSLVIDSKILPAFSNPSHPIPPIIVVDGFPSEIADCYKVAHETTMILFFLQRCVGLEHMEFLDKDERTRIANVVERLWRCTVRLRPLVNNAQPTLLMVGASKYYSPCAHLTVYMTAAHFLEELFQASEMTGYTTVTQSFYGSPSDSPPYDAERLISQWIDVVGKLRNNSTINDGYRLLSEAFYDLAGEATRAARYELGLPIIPVWMRVPR